jgi:hypothetical protein
VQGNCEEEESMKRRIFSIFLISIVGLFLFSIHDKTEAENWKLFFKDEDSTRYYDKDSIHYPYNTRGSLGSITTDKNSVRVWVKKVGLSTKGLTEEEIKILKKYPQFSSYPFLYLEEVRCSQRVIKEIERRFYDYKESIFIELSPEHIIPGSWEEKLYNEVCE